MNKEFWKAVGIRALRTVCQTLGATLPVGYVITPAIIQALDWSALYVALAWLGTGLLAGLGSVLTSIATGLPEVELAKEAPQTEYENEEFYDGEEEYILVRDDEKEGK